MALISFEQLKQLLKDAVQDPNFIGANSILQDGLTQSNLFDHVTAIRPGVTTTLQEQHVQDANVTGLVTLNRLDRRIEIAAGDPAPAENLITFDALDLVVPHMVRGWIFGGDLDASEFEVRVRTSATGPWRRIQQRDAFVAGVTTPPVVDQTKVTLTVQVKVAILAAPKILNDIVLLLEHL